MLRTLPQTRDSGLAYRLTGIAVFTLLSIIAARISIPMQPVPFTLQTFAVLLAGMMLGARDGALSQLIYVAMIAAGLPLDSRGLGQAALFGPTGGYLIGFIIAAGVTGYLTEKGADRLWPRWLAGIAGVLCIYLFGVPFLKAVTGLDWNAAWVAGAAQFIIPDIAKAMIAAVIAEAGRQVVLRNLL